MSFNPIQTTIGGAKTWNEIGNGFYGESTVTFGSPVSALRITRGKLNPKTGIVTCTFSRVLEKATLVNGSPKIQTLTVTVSIAIPPIVDFTTTDVDNAIALLSEFASVQTLDRMLKGEQ